MTCRARERARTDERHSTILYDSRHIKIPTACRLRRCESQGGTASRGCCTRAKVEVSRGLAPSTGSCSAQYRGFPGQDAGEWVGRWVCSVTSRVKPAYPVHDQRYAVEIAFSWHCTSDCQCRTTRYIGGTLARLAHFVFA